MRTTDTGLEERNNIRTSSPDVQFTKQYCSHQSKCHKGLTAENV